MQSQRDAKEAKKKKKCNTHSDESMKYIPRAPILRAKTKTTWRDRRILDISRHKGLYNRVDNITLVEIIY